MRNVTALAIWMVAASAPCTAMAQKTCSVEAYDRADASLPSAAANWRSLMKHQSVFASCDDGALAEGYSEAVVTLLARRWDQFGIFVALAKKHEAFHRWVLRHIDASTSADDLKKIVRNAAHCDDVNAKALCAEVRRSATAALSN